MRHAIDTVLGLASLAPSPEVNQAFSDLVAAVRQRQTLPDWCDEALQTQVQQRCAAAESELESYWAEWIAAAADPIAELAAFPYLDNYDELVRREEALLAQTGMHLSPESRVAMIGSGPLPLTAWYLARHTGAVIDHVDSSAAAIASCQRLSTALAWQQCQHIVGDGATVQLPSEYYDVIYVAGLAGDRLAIKQRIVDNILPALRASGRLVVRSARGARTLLYPAFAAESVQGVRLVATYHPTDEIINSVYVYRKEVA